MVNALGRRRRRCSEFLRAQDAASLTKCRGDELTRASKRQLRLSTATAKYNGIRGWFRRLERKSYRMHVRVLLARYRGYLTCPELPGSRLKPDALHYRD